MTTENSENKALDPMNMPVVDKGVMFVKNPVEHEKHKRMTKQELHDFVRWSFKHVKDEEWSTMSNARMQTYTFKKLVNTSTEQL